MPVSSIETFEQRLIMSYTICKYLIIFLLTIIALPTTTQSVWDDVNCDFEASFCNYIPNFEFERYKGKAPGQFYGPPYDHTTGTGYYALCRGELLSTQDTCQLNKTFTNENQELDYTFWYYFNGLTVGSFDLYLDNKVIWSVYSSEHAWKKAVVSFPVGTFTVMDFLS